MKYCRSIICVLLVGLLSCKHAKTADSHFFVVRQNQQLMDATVARLRHCDLVFRRGKDFTSYLFSQLNEGDKAFSHCGVVLFENGKPYVYHAIGGEENPNQTLKKDAAKNWLSYGCNETVGIARMGLSKEEENKLEAFVRKAFLEKKKFDNQFSLESEDRYYCSEFVYKSMNAAFDKDTVFRVINKYGHRFIPVENLYHNSRAKLVWQVSFK